MSRIDEIRERVNKATEGPWVIDGQRIIANDSFHCNGMQRNSVGISSASYSDSVCETPHGLELSSPKANFDFIAHAREDIPYLLDLLDQKDAEIAALDAKED